jgi:hypothetical protein
MKYEDLKNEVYEALKTKPTCLRDGQFVFNYIDTKYQNIARIVQHDKNIDCFYDDSCIDTFIAECCAMINQYEEL